MNDRFAESSRNVLSEIVELAFYSISVLLIFLTLGMPSSLTLQWYPCASANDAHRKCGPRTPWPA